MQTAHLISESSVQTGHLSLKWARGPVFDYVRLHQIPPSLSRCTIPFFFYFADESCRLILNNGNRSDKFWVSFCAADVIRVVGL